MPVMNWFTTLLRNPSTPALLSLFVLRSSVLVSEAVSVTTIVTMSPDPFRPFVGKHAALFGQPFAPERTGG